MLDEIISGAGDQGVRHTLLGMAHRGRLNVLAHVLDKPYAEILAEFKDPVQRQNVRLDLGWRGDVKYHAGARTASPRGQMFVTLVPNPSHLEAVNPVVEGMARAAGTRTADSRVRPCSIGAVTLPILIHGDAAFPGQGIVAETLNLSRLAGYETGGTIHIIANNQLGFTATPAESYSTSYASGLARGFKIPIVHVNADDPVACLEAARMAWEYRARFHRDFLIDLVGYRRYGHNEGDEPSFTQPLTVQDDRAASDGPDDLGSRAAATASCARRGRGARRKTLRHPRSGVRFGEDQRSAPAGYAGACAARHRRQDRNGSAARTPARAERGAARTPRGLYVSQEARARAREAQAGARRPGSAHHRLGDGRRARICDHRWPTASRSG